MITVHLPKFEGPLDLLLYLIRKDEMDIFDIKIHEITKQYLDFIKMMKELDLEVAGEFVSMASTLIHIKSRMLLPQYNEQGELVENDDPRKELVQRLLEYQKFQEAAKKLSERPWVGRDIWARGSKEIIKPYEEEIALEENALFSLITAYRNAIRLFQKKIHKVALKAQSIASRILEIKDRLKIGHRVVMKSLIQKTESMTEEVLQRQILITFLSLLELGKMGFVNLFQSETYGDIYIDPKKEIQSDIISRVEEFDGMGAKQAAEDLFAKAEETRINEEPLIELNENGEQEQATITFQDNEIVADVDGLPLINNDFSLGAEEMATDEEILAAEKEFENLNEQKSLTPFLFADPQVENSNLDIGIEDSSEKSINEFKNKEEDGYV